MAESTSIIKQLSGNQLDEHADEESGGAMNERLPPVRRARNGQYVATLCPDPNCGGTLQLERETRFGESNNWWRCDGLTHDTPDGALRECHRAVEAPNHAGAER